MPVLVLGLLRVPRVTEAQLQARVIELAVWEGLAVFHCHNSLRSTGPGYPDLTIAGAGGMLFAELKSATGILAPDQRAWRDRLRAAGQLWRLWRPADWASRAIQGHLAMLADGEYATVSYRVADGVTILPVRSES